MLREFYIPKKIHYVWMGDAPKSELAIKCIESWKKYLPGYEIIEWNENNFDMNCCEYIKEAYAAKKWAFVSDAVRVYVLKEFGGVYFDTDVELFNKPKKIFNGVNAILGFDSKFLLSTGVLVSVAHHPIFEELWNYYCQNHFKGIGSESTINTKLTYIVMDYIKKHRLTNDNYNIRDLRILRADYFNGNNTNNKQSPIFAVHHFEGSWKTRVQLTFVQYATFALKCKMLQFFSLFINNKTYIRINDSMWERALKKTTNNITKRKKIYKVL